MASTISPDFITPTAAPASAPAAPHAITALRYRLYARPVDLAPLVIRQVRHITWGEAAVSIYVLGASHALTVALPDGRTFAELLTCLPPGDLPMESTANRREWAIPGRIGGAWKTRIDQSGFCGSARLAHFGLTSAADVLDAAFAGEDTLHEPFSLPTGETAWTRVAWRIHDGFLVLETIHTYPEDGAGIRSTTCLGFCE